MSIATIRRRLLTAPLLALALVGSAAGGASAAPGCPAGQICVWRDGPFVGSSDTYSGELSYHDLRPGSHDEVSSWHNATDTTWCLIDFPDGVTTIRTILDRLGPGEARGVLPAGANDKADAIERC
ncbi:MAG: peptidase inhibitor family I36 protein [Egibacteraceae bacterium]